MIRCFMITPADSILRQLRMESREICPESPWGGRHWARITLDSYAIPYMPDADGIDWGDTPLHAALVADDTLPWPSACEFCGAPFAPYTGNAGAPFRAIDFIRQWRDDAGNLYNGPHHAPAGAMYRARWLREHCSSQDDGAPLAVMTPGGPWIIDSQASNCTMPDDIGQQRHHCWIRHGIPPMITVDKNGPTCAAGGGSIQSRDYHGFLRDGAFTDS